MVETYHEPKLGLFSLSIHVELRQEVLLKRNPAVGVVGTTWETVETGIVGKKNVQKIRDGVKDDVDKFINAYLTANPKK